MQTRQECVTTSLGLLILRLGFGGFMATHGWSKLQMLLAGDASKMPDLIGLGSELSLVAVTAAEFFCAILVMLGLATRLAAAPIVFAMGVAAFIAHGNDPWLMEEAYGLYFQNKDHPPVSKEPAILYLIPFLALVFTGPGRLSLDAIILRRWRGCGSAPPMAAT